MAKQIEYKRPTRLKGFKGLNYDHMPRAVNRDNKGTYNYGSGASGYTIRVPSMKRSKRTWRNFYNLFPGLKGLKTYRGSKLKKID